VRGGCLIEAVLSTWRLRRFGGRGRLWRLPLASGLGLAATLGCGAAESPLAGPDKPHREAAQREVLHRQASRSWWEQLEGVRQGRRSELWIEDGWVDDQAFSQLPGDAAVERLWLDHGRLTDQSVPRLAGLSQLRSIRLRHSPLSDDGVACLAQLPRLESLNLPQAALTAVGLSAFRAHPTLIQLRVAGAGIDDACCDVIAQLPALRYLHLIAPTITGSGLLQLAAAPQLQSLYIDACELPAEAWEAFFRRAPGVHVHVDQTHLDLDPNRHRH
jgi:hypothetical protein